MPDVVTMDKIVSLCKRRGFIFQSSEIYGGLASTYDYGHYGVLLKNNVKGQWQRAMIQMRNDIVALDAAILMHPRVWEASGHLAGFSDPLVQCLGECKKRWREDHLRETKPEGGLRCPECWRMASPATFAKGRNLLGTEQLACDQCGETCVAAAWRLCATVGVRQRSSSKNTYAPR